MGITPTPDPGEFVAGVQCDTCTLVTPLFAPGATPLTTVITVHGWNGGSRNWTLTQAGACFWTFNDADWAIGWHVREAGTGRTLVAVFERIAGILQRRFHYFALPPCQTNVSNTEAGAFRKGTWAELNWS